MSSYFSIFGNICPVEMGGLFLTVMYMFFLYFIPEHIFRKLNINQGLTFL